MLTESYCLKSLDPGFAALMDDLSDRGLLDDTLVAMLWEFGVRHISAAFQCGEAAFAWQLATCR